MVQGKYCILIAEDTMKMRNELAQFLTEKGCVVLQAVNGEQALDLYGHNSHKIDMVLLDIIMPLIDGYEVLRQLREISRVPIIILSAKATEADQLRAFDGGADDYLIKPYSQRMLYARMRSVLTRSSDKVKKVLQFGCMQIYPANRQVKVNGKDVPCTQKEYDLLFYFCDNQGITVSREQILNGVWGYDYVGDLRTVDTHVKQLRAKFSNTCLKITTSRGVGYRFEVEGEKYDENGMCIQKANCPNYTCN